MSAVEFAFRNIRKEFGSVVANDDVCFEVGSGSIHGVVGENGAGKSTIMKILYGMYQPDAGEIHFRGKAEVIRSPKRAIQLGIGMVHQHFMLVPTLSVWRNIILGDERRFWLHPKAAVRELDALQKSFGFSLDLEATIDSLPVGLQQQVEILKLLYRNSQVLILDEPTAVLTPQEIESLFKKLETLHAAGKTVVLISHKLKEILRLTQSVTVMRQGKVVDTLPTAGLTTESLAEKIIGHRRDIPHASAVKKRAEAVAEVRSLSLPGLHRQALSDVSFQVHAGEIVGVAGIEGNGQQELIEALAGVRTDHTGEVTVLGRSVAQEGYTLRQSGFALLPADRHREAVVLRFSAAENILLGHQRESRFRTGYRLSQSKIEAETRSVMQVFDVRPREPQLPVQSFSGGNQQKLVVGRELHRGAKFILAAHPTRGVDIGAIDFIHAQFLRLRDEGAGILLFSSELEEILALSDRILVMYQGKFSAQAVRGNVTERELGLAMTGCAS